MKQILLRKKRKEPRDNGWRRVDYTADQVAEWKTDGGNIGLRLEAGDLVIDVDPKHADARGRTARQLLDLLELEFDLDFSDDLIVETGGKVAGYHVHVTKPAGVRVREKLKGRFGGAIEFKSLGRQVLAPGCTHPDGGTYRTIQGSQRRPCPPALLAAIARPPKAERRAGGGVVAPTQLSEALAQLDPQEFRSYDEWRDLMFACHHGTGGSAEGREAFKAWSVSDPIYADAGGDVDYFWEGASLGTEDARTIATLHYQLAQRGLGMPPGDPVEDFADLTEWLRAKPQQYTPRWRMTKGDDPKIRSALVHNVREAIRVLGHTFYRDDFSGNVHHEKTGELLTDDHLIYLGVAISDGMGLRWSGDPSKDKRQEAVVAEAKGNHRHPIREYLEALTWDGRSRMETWLIEHAGAEPSAYVRGVSRLFLLAAIARVQSPGCKFDLMLVLEGPQGVGKSSLVHHLGGKWALEGLPPLRSAADKDVVDAMRGYWLVEMEEMAVARKSDADTLKAFLTRRVDRVRLPYERNSRDFPRRCVFVGTTNDAKYLRDSTGNRRFVPVSVGRIDLDGLDADQVWAEAYASWQADPDHRRLKLPENLWAAASAEQEKRRIADPWEELVAEVVEKFRGQDFVASETILTDAVGIMPQNQSPRETKRLSVVMQRLGIKDARTRVQGLQKRGYTMPE